MVESAKTLTFKIKEREPLRELRAEIKTGKEKLKKKNDTEIKKGRVFRKQRSVVTDTTEITKRRDHFGKWVLEITRVVLVKQ